MDTQAAPQYASRSQDIGLVRKMSDVAIIVATAALSIKLYPNAEWTDDVSAGIVLAAAAFQVVAEAVGLYGSWRGSRFKSELTRLLGVWFATLVILLVVGYATKTTADYSRIAITVWMFLTPVFLVLARVARRAVTRSLYRSGRNTHNVAILGANDLGVRVAEVIDDAPELGFRLAGFFDDRCEKSDRISWPGRTVGGFDDLVRVAQNHEIDLIYVTLPMAAERRIRELLDTLADTTVSVRLVPDFFAFDLINGRWSDLQGLPTVSVFDTPFWGIDGGLKRLQDIVLSFLILTLISPLLLLIAAAIRVTSPDGPVIFKQRRYGLEGRPICVWKFRTMRTCDNGAVVQQATRDDDRVTPLGRFLRRTSLDELPQFFNVLSGEMSIVGPRPHAVAHNEMYRSLIKGYMLRHKVKPGITGWAQVNGWRGETSTLDKMEKRVEHDLWYIHNWSLWLDLKIVFQTVFKGFVGAHAY